MKNSKNNTAGQAMKAKSVNFNPAKQIGGKKFAMSSNGSLCDPEDMRNPNA
jgi:hypothetical protein